MFILKPSYCSQAVSQLNNVTATNNLEQELLRLRAENEQLRKDLEILRGGNAQVRLVRVGETTLGVHSPCKPMLTLTQDLLSHLNPWVQAFTHGARF